LGLDRASTTAIPISNTGIIPAGGITTSNPTMGTTEDRHTIRITGIERIPVTTVIICIKPRWAQSARFDEIVFCCLTSGLGQSIAFFVVCPCPSRLGYYLRILFKHSQDIRGFTADPVHAVIRVYDQAGKVIETHKHAGDFKRVVNSCLLVCGAVLRAWWIRECQDSSVGLKPASSSGHLAGQSLAAAVRYKTLQLVALRRRS
jgi:hypothetical protein